MTVTSWPDPLYLDDEEAWLLEDLDIAEGAELATAAWLVALLAVAAALVLVLALLFVGRRP